MAEARAAEAAAQELQDIITGGSIAMLPSRGEDEIVPGLFLAEADTALDRDFVLANGFGFVLNVADDDGSGDTSRRVPTGADFYGQSVRYHGVGVDDCEDEDLQQHFGGIVAFLDEWLAEALEHGPDKCRVLVNCRVGASRSAAAVLAFLVAKGMALPDAVRLVRSRREIFPNISFLRQLVEFERELEAARGGPVPVVPPLLLQKPGARLR